MYRTYRQSLFERFRAVLLEKFQVEIPRLTVEEPPKVEMGDYALPIAFELARTLRKAPRKIAEELVGAIDTVPVPSHGRPHSLVVSVPPLGGLVFVPGSAPGA